jgi:hypothetical protein
MGDIIEKWIYAICLAGVLTFYLFMDTMSSKNYTNTIDSLNIEIKAKEQLLENEKKIAKMYRDQYAESKLKLDSLNEYIKTIPHRNLPRSKK